MPMPDPPGQAKNPVKFPATSGWQAPPAQPVDAPPTPPVEKRPLTLLAVPPLLSFSLLKPAVRPDRPSCAVVKLTLTVPPETSVPTAPVPESVGRVPPPTAYDTWPDVGSAGAALP